MYDAEAPPLLCPESRGRIHWALVPKGRRIGRNLRLFRKSQSKWRHRLQFPSNSENLAVWRHLRIAPVTPEPDRFLAAALAQLDPTSKTLSAPRVSLLPILDFLAHQVLLKTALTADTLEVVGEPVRELTLAGLVVLAGKLAPGEWIVAERPDRIAVKEPARR